MHSEWPRVARGHSFFITAMSRFNLQTDMARFIRSPYRRAQETSVARPGRVRLDATRLGIIDDGDVNRAARAAKLRDERLQCGAMLANFFKPIGRLNVAKKSKKAKRGAPARKKKGMKKAAPAKRKKKPAPKPAPAPVAPSPPLGEGFGGKTEDQ